MKFIKRLLPCLIFLLFSVPVSAQESSSTQDRITPMHEFLRENADSTITFRFNSSWIYIPEWFILSKKGDTLTAYHYQGLPAYDPKIVLPGAMALKLKKRVVNIFNVTVDINEYFNPIYIRQDTLHRFWQNVSNLHLWQIKDDVLEGMGCPEEKGKTHADIFDADGITIFLMTKNDVKKLYFYAPEFYQKECPREGRRDILKLQQLFLSHFTPPSL